MIEADRDRPRRLGQRGASALGDQAVRAATASIRTDASFSGDGLARLSPIWFR
jgi:hypothetical protein